MSDQSRRARADWTVFEAGGRDLEARAEALGLEREDIATQIEPLQLAIEGGSIEYKRSLVAEGFRSIEDARYRSLTSAQITGIAQQFALFAYICTIQRQLSDGTIAIRDLRQKEGERFGPEPESDVKAIIADVQERVQADASLRTEQQVKNILMQLSRYSRELEQFKEVTARTPADKRGVVASNFRQTTDEIFASIRKNYEQLMQDERESIGSQPQHILLRLPIKKLSGLLLRQARTGVELRSGLLFARDEQRGTRELLLEIAERHTDVTKMIDEEERMYEELAGTKRLAIEVARAFARELEKRVERETEVY